MDKDNLQLLGDDKLTIGDVLSADVFSETYCIAFERILAKFVEEYDDMAQMESIRLGKELLNTIRGCSNDTE